MTAPGILRVDWQAFGGAIRARSIAEFKGLIAIEKQLGISHARMVAVAQGKPVGTEIFLTLCHWMQADPMQFVIFPAAPEPSS